MWKSIESSIDQIPEGLLLNGEKYLELVKQIINYCYHKLGIISIIDSSGLAKEIVLCTDFLTGI